MSRPSKRSRLADDGDEDDDDSFSFKYNEEGAAYLLSLLPTTASSCCAHMGMCGVVWCGMDVWTCQIFFLVEGCRHVSVEVECAFGEEGGAVPPCRQYVIKGCDESSTLGVAWKRCVSHSHGSCFKEKHS